ncbi:MAG: hypothetical protein JWN52_745 [Actinomycetia bacterium]|nr:hypothetical protein [Actinomycetes bacterium]
MKVILFGGTGMVGQGVLRECLLNGGVESEATATWLWDISEQLIHVSYPTEHAASRTTTHP